MLLCLVSLIAAIASGQQTPSGGTPDTLPVAPLPAQETAPAPETPAAPPAAPPRMICRSEQVTGTRFPIRRCRQAGDTEAERAESQEMLRRMQGARTPPAG